MRSPRRQYIERIERGAEESARYVDMRAVVRVVSRVQWSGGAFSVAESRLWPVGFGGVWDRWSGDYLEPGRVPDEITTAPHEFLIHPGQARLFDTMDDPDAQVTLSVAAPGSGKTEGGVVFAACLALWKAGKPAGMVAPTRPRRAVLWKKFRKAVPNSWIQDVRTGTGEIELVNGSVLQFVSTKRQSEKTGSPIAGLDWAWALGDEFQDIDDDSADEINARGRIAADFRVTYTATNEARGYLQRRIQEFEGHEKRRVLRVAANENVFVPPEHWERIRQQTDPETFRRRYLAEDVPITGRVYPAFSARESLRPVPLPSQVGRPSNVTGELTASNIRIREHYDYIVGVDFGVRTSASVVMQCHRAANAGRGDYQWWVLDEVVTENQTNDWHAAKLLEWFAARGMDQTSFVAIKGNDNNSLDKDKSNNVLFARRGINIIAAAPGRRLYVHHRYSMVNACLHSADGKRRLFLDCDEHRRVRAKRTFDSFQQLMLNASDKAETYGKGTKGGEDLTHYTDAVGYALFPFEKFRGVPGPGEEIDGSGDPQRRGA